MLDDKARKFCELVAGGAFGYEAYASVYGCSVTSAKRSAYRKLAEEDVRVYLDELRAQLREGVVLDLTKKRVLLAEIATGKAVFDSSQSLFEERPSHGERMKAIDLDNRMMGDYAPEKSDVNVQGSFFNDLFDLIDDEGQGSKGVGSVEGTSGVAGLAFGESVLD